MIKMDRVLDIIRCLEWSKSHQFPMSENALIELCDITGGNFEFAKTPITGVVYIRPVRGYLEEGAE